MIKELQAALDESNSSFKVFEASVLQDYDYLLKHTEAKNNPLLHLQSLLEEWMSINFQILNHPEGIFSH